MNDISKDFCGTFELKKWLCLLKMFLNEKILYQLEKISCCEKYMKFQIHNTKKLFYYFWFKQHEYFTVNVRQVYTVLNFFFQIKDG